MTARRCLVTNPSSYQLNDRNSHRMFLDLIVLVTGFSTKYCEFSPNDQIEQNLTFSFRFYESNKFHKGNSKDGKHYWITPSDLLEELNKEFNFTFDPCPYPLPEGFDGLTNEWGKSNYVNPPFGSIIHKGKKKGPTAWVRKAIDENEKGKDVVLVYPIDKWILMMVKAGAEIRNLGDVKWLATEDKSPGKGTGRHIACFILKGKKK